MAIDTERKRKSAAWVGQVFSPPTVLPDGSFAQGDRQTIAWSYYGINAQSPGGFEIAWTVGHNTLIGGGIDV